MTDWVAKNAVARARQNAEIARQAYLKAANARKPSTILWNAYAVKLHHYRILARSCPDWNSES